MLCPEFLEALDAEPDCWREYAILQTFGSAFLAYDMRGLSGVERSRRIEHMEALLIYNLVGETIFLPFCGKDKDKDNEQDQQLCGVLSANLGGVLNATGLLALLANGNARRQFREQFPSEYKQLCERAFHQNDVEAGFSEARLALSPHTLSPRSPPASRRCAADRWADRLQAAAGSVPRRLREDRVPRAHKVQPSEPTACTHTLPAPIGRTHLSPARPLPPPYSYT